MVHQVLSLTLSHLQNNPSTYVDLTARYLRPAQDLTGQITKDESYYFAYGGHADIWKGKWTQKHSGDIRKVAVKVLKGPHDSRKRKVQLYLHSTLPWLTFSVFDQQLLRELSIWSTVQHPYITPFFGITFDFDRPCTPCFVSPYYRHGDITSYVKEQPSVNKLALLAQVASALSHLHSISIVHMDMKGKNILIDDNGNARLTDFGLGCILQTSGYTRTTPSGTVRWMARELVATSETGEEQADPQPTMEADVWAFALTVIEIFTNSIPFSYIKRDIDVIFHILSGGRPDRTRCSEIKDDIWRMLEACWDDEPNRRPRMGTIFTILSLSQNAQVPA